MVEMKWPEMFMYNGSTDEIRKMGDPSSSELNLAYTGTHQQKASLSAYLTTIKLNKSKKSHLKRPRLNEWLSRVQVRVEVSNLHGSNVKIAR